MPTLEIQVHRFSIISPRSFEDVVSSLTAAIGRPDTSAFRSAIGDAKTVAELEQVVRAAVGSSELMEFIRFDLGNILRKRLGRQQPRILRLILGNPLIMMQLVETVPDAASYAPVTILIDERADGVHLSYDSMASLIAPYGSRPALLVAKKLDRKIEALLMAAAR